ncbi:MAG: glycoside hydrolase family 71/99-like protein [Bacteroides sp.]|nr:glycoside hydrolase family 71/99-like protein [Bacteroides sp.]MCM1095278.1 glycoside hydrolase family 71/99-like protein [Terasakiella sp.]
MLSVALLTSACSVTKSTSLRAPARYDSYKTLVMAGYQGWFNAEGDGSGRGFYHYSGHDGFKPGSASVDMWPDVAEYAKTYPTSFAMPDGSDARVFSSGDSSTVDTHFRWMQEYGLDGVFMQRFVAEIKNPSGRRHFDRVLSHAMGAADRYRRAIAVMYDLSGIKASDLDIIVADIDSIAARHTLFDREANPSYLWHNGAPLVAIWGVGFNDGRGYTIADTRRIVQALKAKGYSVMLGVPTNWRDLQGDTEPDPALHSLIKSCDVVMPWFVGRYDEAGYETFVPSIEQDIKWCKAAGVDYAPLVYPGFSWKNMCGEGSFNVPRNSGRFFTRQLEGAIEAGAEMIYVAMFDEIDEGTAIFKCAKRVPVSAGGTRFVPIDSDVDNDFYLKAAGEAALRLKSDTRD